MQESAGSTRGSVTRRAFVKGALAAGVTAGFAGLAGPVAAVAQEEAATATGTAPVKDPQYSFEFIPEAIDESLIVETVDCDILVVGAGVSGMAGIMYGAAQSANVHVLEKGPTHGVHRLCVAGLNSKLAVAATGSTIDPKDFTQDFYRATGGFQTKVPVVSRYAKDSGKWIDWLVEAMAPYGWSLLPPTNTRKQGSNWVEYDTPHFFMNPDGENIMTGKTPNWMELFHKIAEDLGATFHFNEPAVRLEREGELSGRVTSVISKNLITGEYRRYSASKSVLCAAGDMFNDKELVHKYCAFLEKTVSSIVEPNNTGDMHKAAMWVGAAMDDYSAGDLFGFQSVECKNYAGPRAGEADYNPLLDTVRGTMWAPAVAGYPVLWVDDGGRRFVNEDMNNFQQAGAQTIITTPTGKAWSIWDSAWESKFPAD